MKKLFYLFLAMVMSLSLVACGANNDENNAAIQAKVDEAATLAQDIIAWYTDNGYLEGDSAVEAQATVDSLAAQIETLKTANQEFLDAGGYDDDMLASKLASMDTVIASLQKVKDELLAYGVSEEGNKEINNLIDKYNILVGLVEEASIKGDETGWSEDEAFVSEHTAALEYLKIVQEDLQNPDTMDEEYMNKLSVSLDEMIPAWQDYVAQVSEPYTK